MLKPVGIKASALSGLRENFRGELLAVFPLLGLRQKLKQAGNLTYEVSLDPSLPFCASFCSIELPIVTVGQLEVEDSGVKIV